MAEKGFGVKEINLIGASGTPTIESPNNLNLNAVNVAISTNATIGGNLTVTGTVGIAGTLTYEDVTSIDAIGIITARKQIKVLSDGINVVGVSTFSSVVHASQFNGSGGGLTSIPANQLTGTYATLNGFNITNLNAANLTGNLPAISGANLTGIAVTEAPVTDYTISANGSSAYRIHGGGVDETANSPDLYLIRGQKYRFNNTTGSGHPFAIREANGGSAYTDGVSGSQTGIQFFTVPYDAPAKIFYQCTIHGGMVGNIYIRGGSSTANISNNSDNRVITGGSDGNLNGEVSLIYTGSRMGINASGGSITDVPSTSHDTVVVGNSSMTSGGIVLQGAADASSNLGYQMYKGGSYPCARMLYEGSSNELQFHSTSTAAGSTPSAESRKMRLLPGGNVVIDNGDLVLASGHGIDFGATGGPTSGTGGSEILSDYEQGTFSPNWFDDGGVFVSSYTTQYGQYTKIGNVVYFCFGLRIASFSRTPNSGQVCRVGNLPYVSRAVGDDQEPVFNLYARLWGSGTPPETAWIRQSSGGSGSNHVEFYMDESQTGNDHALVGADFDTSATCRVVVNGFYFTTD